MNKILIGVAIAVVVLMAGLVGVYIASDVNAPTVGVGAIGTLPVENYVPVIKQNEGYYSELPLTATDGTFTGGTLNISTANTATSTLIVGCIQYYATSTLTPLRFQATTTGIMIGFYGSCPNL